MTTSRRIGISWTNSPACQHLLTLGATCFGIGHAPITPGTLGSLPGIGLFMLTSRWDPATQLVVFVLFVLVAIGLADRAERTLREPDPDCVVIDEVVGMWVTCLFLWRVDGVVLLAGFLLFRSFDILKIFPLNVFEGFRGGVGIVADDLAAGMLANLALRILLLLGIFC